jgi:hypothetical protein
MKILSWDIGIKNLSYCLIENNTIVDWDVINLDDEEIIIKCDGKFKNGKKCTAKSVYLNKDKSSGYCKTHYKKLDESNNTNFKEVKKPKKKKINLLDIGNRLVTELDKRFNSVKFDNVLLENQPSLKNPTMKSVQIIIFSYFLINGYNKDTIKHIQMISATQKNKYCNNYCKLNTHIKLPSTKSSYNNAKKTAILVTDDILKKIYVGTENVETDNVGTDNVVTDNVVTDNVETDNVETDNVETDNVVTDNVETDNVETEFIEKGINYHIFFKEHKKKDDLADSYLQGIQFLQK